MNITKENREKAEALIYEVMDALDPTGTNSDHLKRTFDKMSNKKFGEYFSRRFPLRFHTSPWEVDPKIEDIERGAKVLDIPLLETVKMPHLYQDENGNAIETQECIVGYLNLRKEQQFITKKNSMSTDINMRDMKTGHLVGPSKASKESDRETESLAIMGLENTAKELLKSRADSMEAKAKLNNMISTLGKVTLEDIETDASDSLSLNLLNTYLIGAMLNSNILNKDYLLPHTYLEKDKRKRVTRDNVD